MRYGFTSGSCAAAAAKAACYMLLTGKEKKQISIITPKGLDYDAEIVSTKRGDNFVECGVIKDGGDDPDITSGTEILCKVEYFGNSCSSCVIIEGGEGVGVVTKPGLDQKVGNAAINSIPRQMIEKEIKEVCSLCDYRGGIKVTVSVPEGKKLAERTFNPRLGIEGGISILGTSGVVEPMSSAALIETIKVELTQKKALGFRSVCIAPGNYGLEFIKNTFGYDLDKAVKCSNFIGLSLDMAVELGFEKVVLAGHIGKLIKISGGIFNTHSKEADCRMELLAAAAVKSGCSLETVSGILNCVNTEEGISLLQKEEKKNTAMEYLMERIMFFLKNRTEKKIQTGCIMYSNEFGLLAKSSDALSILKEVME